jgi:hypothetical protein
MSFGVSIVSDAVDPRPLDPSPHQYARTALICSPTSRRHARLSSVSPTGGCRHERRRHRPRYEWRRDRPAGDDTGPGGTAIYTTVLGTLVYNLTYLPQPAAPPHPRPRCAYAVATRNQSAISLASQSSVSRIAHIGTCIARASHGIRPAFAPASPRTPCRRFRPRTLSHALILARTRHARHAHARRPPRSGPQPRHVDTAPPIAQ